MFLGCTKALMTDENAKGSVSFCQSVRHSEETCMFIHCIHGACKGKCAISFFEIDSTQMETSHLSRNV